MSSNAVRDTFGEICMSRAIDKSRIEELEKQNAELTAKLQTAEAKLAELQK